jgi:hypothetical protein
MQKVSYILVSLVFISCSGNVKKPVPRYETCNGEEKAAADIRNNKIIYCNVDDPMIPPIRYKAEMAELLLKQNIIVEDLSSYREPESCYCEFMKLAIDKRFGRYYLDSLNQLAAEMFFVKHENDTIDKWECDTHPAYPGNTDEKNDDDLFQSRFNELVKYPKGYRNRNDSASRDVIFVSLIVEKTGGIRIAKFTPLIENENNIQFTGYLEDQIRNILPHSGWKSATILNHPVHADMNISVYLK